jgi:hypothetical protein
MTTSEAPSHRSRLARQTRNAILLAAAIEALFLIPTLLYLLFSHGR